MTETDACAEHLVALGAATLGESGAVVLPTGIRPVWRGATVAGPAYPVVCPPGDNLAIHAGVVAAPAGSVLAVEVGGAPDRGYFGEVLATASASAGQVGLVIDGCVRDVQALEALGYPVFSRGISLPGATKKGPGSTGGSALLGNVEVRAGDWLVGDVDGVVVVRKDDLDKVLAAGQQRAAKEVDMLRRLMDGATTVEMLGLDTTSVLDHETAVPEKAGRSAGAALPGTVQTAGAPVASGGYAQARWVGDLVFLAGVGPYDPETRRIVGDDIATQTARAMDNAGATLAGAGLEFDDVVSSSVFLAHLNRDWGGFDQVYRSYFTAPFPARAVVGAELKGILVEIVMVARRWR